MTDLYPHEWVWEKVKENRDFKDIVVIAAVASITVLIIGSVTMWLAVNLNPTTNAWQVQTMNQPSAFSYAPIFLCAAFAVLGIGIYSHYYGDEE